LRTTRILKPGVLVTIEVKPDEKLHFIIGSVSDDYRILTCELITEEPRSIDLNKGDKVILVCLSEDGVFRFLAQVQEIKQDPVNLTLALSREASHLQRRKFFRLSEPLVRARYRQITDPVDIYNDELKEAAVKNLSGNGTALVIPVEDELAVGTPVRVEMDVAGQNINLIGEVIRCTSNEPINGMSLLCIQFSLIEERDRDRIIGHLFKEQIKRAGRRSRPYRSI